MECNRQNPSSAELMLGRMGAAPDYKLVFGRHPRDGELIDMVREYSVYEWLGYLSRIQMILARNLSDDEERNCLYGGILPADLQARCEQFRTNVLQKGRAFRVFYERQVSMLQQLVIQHAPELAESHFEDSDAHRAGLATALFMTMNMMNPDRGGDEDDTLSKVIQVHQRNLVRGSPFRYGARALYFYGLARSTVPARIQKLAAMFVELTDVALRDYLLGGLRASVLVRTGDLKEIARAWFALPETGLITNENEKKCAQAYEKLRLRPVQGLREAIQLNEGTVPLSDWSLTAIARFPLVEVPGRGAFVLNVGEVDRSLFDGVRTEMLEAAGRDGSSTNVGRVGHLYGDVFEFYVKELLEAAFRSRVFKIPEGSEKRTDFLIRFESTVVILDAKGRRLKEATRGALKTVARVRRDYEQAIDVDHGVCQLQSTIELLRSGTLDVGGVSGIDWTVTPIVPVIVSEERLPLMPKVWEELFSALSKRLESLSPSGPVARLRFLSLDEVESLPSVQSSVDCGSLLNRWSHSTCYDQPFGVFLKSCGIVNNDGFMQKREHELIQFAVEHLGLERAGEITGDDGARSDG